VRLIEAFTLLSDTLPDHDLVIVGKKTGFITFDREAGRAAAAAGRRIVFTGFLEDSALQQYVAHAEALVYPSLYEGFGLPPLEAMAARCPAVVSDIPALRESCGKEAIYCDPYSAKDIASAMEGVATLPSRERMRLVEAAQWRARHFNWRKTARHTLAAIEEARA
jgi:glycosyltransferase involved in cell wall biosynthesis